MQHRASHSLPSGGRQDSPARDGDSLAPSPLSAGRLLIVDDIPENREILSRRFERHGFEWVEAESGERALALIEAQNFDVVLLDVMMPGLDGNETLARIRRRFGPDELPVIMVTAKTESRDVVDSLSRGANDYLTKPVDMSVAMARVVNQVGARRARVALQRGYEALSQANAAIRAEASLRRASEERIAWLAQRDALTGLANRHSFDEALQKAMGVARETGSEVGLLYLDLDRFKAVNDTFGHAVGDELLKSAANRIAATVEAGETCARLGGDEFAVIHVCANAAAGAAALADRLLRTVSGRHGVSGRQVHVGLSIGLAVSQNGEPDATALLRQADLALYHAKASGRGGVRRFEPQMLERVERRLALELDLREALTRGEFELHYQPVVDVSARRVTGAEALLRWRHPVRGYVSPSEFVPIAEETGLVAPIGEWVLRQACMDAAQWPSPTRVAVNLSPVQFLNANLQSVALRALASAGLPAERLELEITESVILDDSSDNVRQLQALRGLGVRISLDDFGSGYSGLGYFRAFEFDRLKIDQTFVRHMDRDPKSKAIIRAAINLCRSLDMSITAEGVETREQLDWLVGEGCATIQGYYFSKPRAGGDLAGAIAELNASLQAAE